MNKWVLIGMTVAFFSLTSIPFAFSQGEKKIPESKQTSPDVPVDSATYVIGPEDVLSIHVWREEAISKTIPVRSDGKISLPIIDEVEAAGLTPLQLKAKLTERLKEFIDNPSVSVVVLEANSFKVYISGQVRNPGVLRLRSETSLLQFIIMVGGFSEWANQKKILIIRKEKGKERRILVNYKDIVEGKEPNLILKRDDTIIVP